MRSRWERRIDPALEELLTELSGDPQSSLLRVPVMSGALEATQTSARASSLLAAERELLCVFRFELRDLLLEACRRELYQLSGLQVSRWRSYDTRVHVSTEKAWRSGARRTLDDVPEEIEARDALTLLSSCIVHPDSPAPSVSQLAGAAQRVLLDDRARVYVALELIAEESPRAAMSQLYGVLEDDPHTSLRSYCWQNLGVCQHRLGDLHGALESHERALEGDEGGRPGPLLSAFSLALALEEEERASRHAQELEARMGVDHPGLEEELELLRNMTAAEDAAVHAARIRSYQVMEDRLGPLSRRIGYALAR
jgi:tetratricopeptide (TPR) repeat protein